jgi:hypothetical protein
VAPAGRSEKAGALSEQFMWEPVRREPGPADNTAASGANLQPGETILKVQMDDVQSRADLASRLKAVADGGQRDVLLLVGGPQSRWITLPLKL